MLKMSKQSAIILILVVFLGALGALIWFYFTSGTNNSPAPVATTTDTDVYDPFGTRTTNNLVATTTEITVVNIPVNNEWTGEKLRQISEVPISGFSIINNLKTKNTDIHYILRANGNIYEAYVNSLEQKRLSITTVPKVYESTWLPDGVRLVIRYLKDNTENIQTFSVKINPATTTLNTFEGGIDGNHLAENISAIAVNPLGDKIFYLTNGLRGSSGFVSKPDGLNKQLIFESPLVEWLISWPKEGIITLNTKPSAQIPGYMYFLNSQTGDLSKILGNINGLTTKTNKGATEVLYSDSTRGAPKLFLYIIKTGESKQLPWNTFPEKCSWSSTDAKVVYCAVPKGFTPGDYPDQWYQGLVNFTDDIWMINTDTLASTLVFDFQKETNNNIDVTDLQVDSTDNYLFFVNKADLTFWSLNLK
jgi:hypothetical protein